MLVYMLVSKLIFNCNTLIRRSASLNYAQNSRTAQHRLIIPNLLMHIVYSHHINKSVNLSDTPLR